MRKIILLLLFINHLSSFSQEGILTGLILNEENIPVNNVNINYKNKGTISDANGFYNLRVNPNEKINIINVLPR